MTELKQNARVLLSLALVLGCACAGELKQKVVWLPSVMGDIKSFFIGSSLPPPPTTTEESKSLMLIKDVNRPGYLTVHEKLCPQKGAKINLLILIMSAPRHWLQRYGIRMTWGYYGKRSDVAVAFFLGQSSKSMMEKVADEDKFYEDIIIGAFWDAYSNVTLKVLSMLDWTMMYCPLAPRILKCHDDMFINVPRLLHFILEPARVSNNKTIWGHVLKFDAERSRTAKYYLSRLHYPSQIIPEYMLGPAYLMTSDAVPALRAAPSAMPDQPYYGGLEELFITGTLAQEAGVRRKHVTEFYHSADKVEPSPCNVQRSIAIRHVKYHQLFSMWSMLLNGDFRCI